MAQVRWVHPDGRVFIAPDGSYSPNAGTGWTRDNNYGVFNPT